MRAYSRFPLTFDLFIALTAAMFFSLVVMVVLAMVSTTPLREFWSQLTSPLIFSAIGISLQTSLAVVGLTLVLGFPIAYVLALKDFPGKTVLDTLLDLPMGLPPLVSGLAILLLLNGNGVVGRILDYVDISLIFSKKGIILAQLFVAAPFFIKTVRESIAAIPKNLFAASATLSASPFYTCRNLILPLCKSGIWAGLIMTWTRALGEFGATSMVAGCIPKKTETMTIVIYMQAMSGDLEAASALALILVVFTFTMLILLKTRFHHTNEHHF